MLKFMTFALQTAQIKNNFSYEKIFNIMHEIISDIDSLSKIYKQFYTEIVTGLT